MVRDTCRRRRGLLLDALVLAGLLCSTEARAESADREARESARRTFQEAQATFAAGNFAAAGVAFEEAARLVPHSATWLNAAEAWERAGDLARAAEDCDQAAEASANDAGFTGEIARRLARLEPKIASISISGAPTLMLGVDGGSPQPLPLRRRVNAGRHVLRFSAPARGREHELTLILEPGQAWTWHETLPDDAPESEGAIPALRRSPLRSDSAHSAHRGSRLPMGSWIAFGVAGVSAVTAGVFGVLTLGSKDDFESSPTQRGLDDFYRVRAIANVSLGAAIVALSTGLVVWLVAPRPPSPSNVALEGARLHF